MPNPNKTVIVTGASGFIGQHLIPILIKNKYKVIAISRSLEKIKKFEWFKNVDYIKYDLKNKLEGIEVSSDMSLIHLAWSNIKKYNSLDHFEYSLPQSYKLIKFLVNLGVSQVLVTGTCYEYGLQSGPLSSRSNLIPNTSYGLAKNTLRQNLEFLAKEMPYILQWARLFYMYGKGQNSDSLLSQLDRAINNNETVFNMSGGEQLRDYLPVELVAQYLFDLFEKNTAGIYNICSGKPISVRNLVEKRIKEKNSKIKLNMGHYDYLDHEPMAFWGIKDKLVYNKK